MISLGQSVGSLATREVGWINLTGSRHTHRAYFLRVVLRITNFIR